jgi:sortase A
MTRTRIVLRRVRWIYHGLLCVGTICLGLFAWHFFESSYYQAEYERAFARLEAERGRDATGAGRENFATPDGLLGRLEIARLDLQVMVLNRADAASLRRGAGWIRRTAGPGQAGNMGIAGHRDSHFRALQEIRKGDRIVLTTVDGLQNEYRVSWVSVVDPSDVEVLEPTPAASLTLVTCFPFNYVGPAPRRFIVRAVQVSAQG